MYRHIPSIDDHRSLRSHHRSHSHVEGCEGVDKVRRLERRDPSSHGQEEEGGRHEHRKGRHSVWEGDHSRLWEEVFVDRSHLGHSSHLPVEEDAGQASAHGSREDSSHGEVGEARDDRSNHHSDHEEVISDDSFGHQDAHPGSGYA